MFEFLYGLNKDLGEVRGRFLGSKPFPEIKEAFAEVRREESKKQVMLGKARSQIHLTLNYQNLPCLPSDTIVRMVTHGLGVKMAGHGAIITGE